MFGVEKWSQISGLDGEAIAEFEVLASRWLEEDRGALFSFLQKQPTEGNSLIPRLIESVFQEYALAHGLAATLELTQEALFDDYDANFELLPTLFKEGASLTSSSLSQEQVEQALDSAAFEMPFEDNSFVQDYLFSASTDDIDHRFVTLENFLVNTDHPSHKVADWLSDLLQSEELGGLESEQSKKLLKRATTRWTMLRKDFPIEERLDLLEKVGQKRKYYQRQLATVDVREYFSSSRDLAYEFNKGVITAEEALNIAATDLPEISVFNPVDFRAQVYRALVEENPFAADELLNPLPAGKQRMIRGYTAGNYFHGVNPDTTLAYLNSIPDTTYQKELSLQKRNWTNLTKENLQRFGEDYIEWAKEMPEGRFRDITWDSLVSETKDLYPELKDELQNPANPEP